MARLKPYLVLPLLIGLGGCEIFLDATLFNNTGEGVEIRGGDITTIGPNQSAHLIYPNESYNRVFRLVIGRCVYLYDAPENLNDYRLPDFKFRTGRGVQIQVEKDFSINLLPADYAGEGPAPKETVLRREGFPLRPVTKTCQ